MSRYVRAQKKNCHGFYGRRMTYLRQFSLYRPSVRSCSNTSYILRINAFVMLQPSFSQYCYTDMAATLQLRLVSVGNVTAKAVSEVAWRTFKHVLRFEYTGGFTDLRQTMHIAQRKFADTKSFGLKGKSTVKK